jgi:hypothetical protein
MVGNEFVLQHTPLAEMFSPPPVEIVPPEDAEVDKILETAVVVIEAKEVKITWLP